MQLKESINWSATDIASARSTQVQHICPLSLNTCWLECHSPVEMCSNATKHNAYSIPTQENIELCKKKTKPRVQTSKHLQLVYMSPSNHGDIWSCGADWPIMSALFIMCPAMRWPTGCCCCGAIMRACCCGGGGPPAVCIISPGPMPPYPP